MSVTDNTAQETPQDEFEISEEEAQAAVEWLVSAFDILDSLSESEAEEILQALEVIVGTPAPRDDLTAKDVLQATVLLNPGLLREAATLVLVSHQTGLPVETLMTFIG